MQHLEAVGDAITGSVAGRAVEPGAGERTGERAQESHCLNCGTELLGSYCHVCGQHSHVHRTLHAFWHDLVHGVFHFEGKIWRTLPLLVWKPGELTRRYIEGQRARFVSPIALFLFFVFLMFAAVGILGGGQTTTVQNKQRLDTELGADQQKLASLQSVRNGIPAGAAADKIDEKINDTKSEIAAIQAVKSGNLKAAGVVNTDIPFLGKALPKFTQNPELLLYKIKTDAYKFSWALIPISVPFVWLLFPFSRRFRLYDHTVFVTYSLCFMTLLVVAGVLIGAIGLGSLTGLLFLVPPIHMYRQLKGAYALSSWGALWRASLLTIFALIAISLFVSLLVTIGLLD
jgi:hypothetical protein